MADLDPIIGLQLGDYRIEALLGQGGMARVYKGYDDKLNRFAAVKVIEPKLIASADDTEYRERFQREARAIARLNHPRIVAIYQFGQLETNYYMAMGFIEGRDLRDILKEYHAQKRLMSHAQVLQIIRDIAEALDYSHQQGVIHRDIKPSNIMVTADGHAVLTDFGLALDAEEGTLGNTFGSVHYIAPEQAVSSAAAVPQSDLYALAVVVFEMLTGRVPFEDVSAMSVALKHISDPPPMPSTINPTIPLQVEEIIVKALDKDPARRYGSAVEFAESLEGAFALFGAESNDMVIAPTYGEEDLELTPAARPSTPPIVPAMQDISIPSPLPRTGTTDTKTMALPTKNKTQSRPVWPLGIAGAVVAVLILILMTSRGDDSAGDVTPTSAGAAMAEATDALALPAIDAVDADDAEVLLRYDGNSIVLYNRAWEEQSINIESLVFAQTWEDADGQPQSVTFPATDWISGELDEVRGQDCYQLWTVQFRLIPADEFPADICLTRQAFNQTVKTFWVDRGGDTFIVLRDVETLATCPTVSRGDEEEQRCLVDLTP